MSQRGRGQIFTAVTAGFALLFLFLAGALVYDLGASATQRRLEAVQKANQASEDAASKIQASCTDTDPQALRDCIRNEVQATEETRRSEYDLAAQKDVAEWTFWALIVSLFSTAVGGIGIYLVWNSLEQGRQGLEQGRRGVEAAEAAIAVTREMSRRELRAYIAEEKFEWAPIDVPHGIIITQTFRNCGATPARNVRLRVYSVLERSDGLVETVANSTLDPKPYGEHDIGPAMPFVYQQHIGQVHLTDALQGALDGTMHLVVIAEVEYADVFGDDWDTGTAMVLDPTNYQKTRTIKFVRYPKGNKST